eukprot:3035573-Alexandrium_andersonii.AAC.1
MPLLRGRRKVGDPGTHPGGLRNPLGESARDPHNAETDVGPEVPGIIDDRHSRTIKALPSEHAHLTSHHFGAREEKALAVCYTSPRIPQEPLSSLPSSLQASPVSGGPGIDG